MYFSSAAPAQSGRPTWDWARRLSRACHFPSLLTATMLIASPLIANPVFAGVEPGPAAAPAQAVQVADAADFLAISTELMTLLDQKIRPLERRTQQVVALHELLFGPRFFAINYDNTYTKTAQETLFTRSGNCLSLAALYIAAARHLGMEANFQLVHIPNQWEKNRNFNIVLGHVNVRVSIPGHDATVEFMDTYTADEVKKFDSKIISDAEATARYFNNRGAEQLALGERAAGVALLERSTQIYPKFSESWVNLGVGYKMLGRLSEAETAYLRAQKIDRHNLSAINNLHTLYVETGQPGKAGQLADRIRRHQMKNPYHLARLAEHEIGRQQYATAVQHLKKAIKIQPQEADFYLLLGQTYFRTGELAKSEQALQKSVELTRDAGELEKRQKKLVALKNHFAAAY